MDTLGHAHPEGAEHRETQDPGRGCTDALTSDSQVQRTKQIPAPDSCTAPLAWRTGAPKSPAVISQSQGLSELEGGDGGALVLILVADEKSRATPHRYCFPGSFWENLCAPNVHQLVKRQGSSGSEWFPRFELSSTSAREEALHWSRRAGSGLKV